MTNYLNSLYLTPSLRSFFPAKSRTMERSIVCVSLYENAINTAQKIIFVCFVAVVCLLMEDSRSANLKFGTHK